MTGCPAILLYLTSCKILQYSLSAYEKCAALFGMAHLFKEKLSSLVTHEENNQEPVLLVLKKEVTVSSFTENGFTLQVEGNVVVECDSFLELFMSLIGAIFCYNLVYPKQIRKTLAFIESIILGLKNEQGIDKKIISVVAAVKRANQE